MSKNYAIKASQLHKKFWYFKKDMKAIRWLFNKNSYDQEFHVLKGIDFKIDHGEAVGILGVNGAGKSTLLKIVSGIYHPTSGEVVTEGRISSLLELGAGFNMQLTGRENIYLKGTLLGYATSELDKMIDDIVQFADIGEYMDMPLDSYSSGMSARLGFALAVTVDPDILIIDEVFAVGDKNFQQKSRAKTMEFFDAGKTILFVSHSESLIRQFCQRVIYLKDGHIAFDGAVEEGLALYQADVELKSRIPCFFFQDAVEDDENIILNVNYGMGRELKIIDTLDIKDLIVSAERYTGERSEYFIHADVNTDYKIVNDKSLQIILKKSDVVDKINIRIKLLDSKYSANNFLIVTERKISLALNTFTDNFLVDSDNNNTITIEAKKTNE